MSKVAIIGAGQVGAATAVRLLELEVAKEVVLHDVIEDLPQGKALDMLESSPVVRKDVRVVGTNTFDAIQGSDVVVVAAGFPRKPGMDRLDLLRKNLEINQNVVVSVKRYAPHAHILYVANPLDLMTYAAWRLSGFPPNRVYGMAGLLDTARFRTFVAMELGVSVADVTALVLGGHGDSMVPLPRFCQVAGVPLADLLPPDRIQAIVDRTRQGGGEIVKLLKTGSAYYAPGAAVAEMVEAVLRDKKRVLPVCAHLGGEYGYRDLFVGVPAVLGRNGVEKVIELKLNAEEKALFDKSVGELKGQVAEVDKLLAEGGAKS